MSLPNVTIYNLAASSSALIAGVQTPGTTANLVLATGILDNQRRVVVSSGANDSTIQWIVVGTNQAGFAVTDTLAGTNNGSTQSNLDFKTVTLIRATVTTAAGTVSAGTNGVGSSLWNIVNYQISPSNIAVSGVVTSANTAVNYTVQYTYDDPNNLPTGATFPQPFNHPTIAAATTSLDGAINDPVLATRLTINSGTGVVRFTNLQAGISE